MCVCVCVYLMMSMCPFLAARCSGDVPLGSVVSPFLGSSKAAHMLLDSNNWTTLHTHKQREDKQLIVALLLTNTDWNRRFLPQLCRTHRPGPEGFSLRYPRCTGWTGAAAASQTGDGAHRHMRQKSIRSKGAEKGTSITGITMWEDSLSQNRDVESERFSILSCFSYDTDFCRLFFF